MYAFTIMALSWVVRSGAGAKPEKLDAIPVRPRREPVHAPVQRSPVDLSLDDLSDNPRFQRLQKRISKLERENHQLRQQLLLEKSRLERLQDIQWRYERIVALVTPFIQDGSIAVPD
jgi:hypothetical protein